jgi:hypothetical protein
MLSTGSNTCTVVSGLTASSMTCTFSIDPIATNKDVLTINGAFDAVQTSGTIFEIKI